MNDTQKAKELLFSKTNTEQERLAILKTQLNEVGPGFCAAKWYMATIWLGNGRTSSCHHPPAHTIQHSDIENNPSGLHNTAFKKQQRKEMLLEKRPDECGYCWRVEDANEEAFSDRVIKSSCIPWSDTFREVVDWQTWPEDVLTITSDAYKKNYNPRILEISFDNLCNLACSYCNSEFSSTWANDIKKNGPYIDMQTANRGTWERAVDFEFDPKSQENIYIKKFFEWFDGGLREDLKELRVTGGEPTRSPSFWKLVDKCVGSDFKFSVNTNLMMDEKRLQRLIDCSYNFKDFEIFTSCETTGDHADFIRSGLDYEVWLSNLEHLAKNANATGITVMMTINALCLFRITDFLDDIVALKTKLDNKKLFRLSLNILRFPSFQSVNILPQDAKNRIADNIQVWIDNNKDNIENGELLNIERLVVYLREVDKSYEDQDSIEAKINDFDVFYTQYGNRNGMNFRDIFADSFNEYNINYLSKT